MTNDKYRRVFCVGETVLDIIFQDDRPVAANPGGSMLNSAISLGRAGIPVYFISDFANDHAGDMIQAFLEENGVSTQYISRYTNGKTATSLAFLDDQQNADYSFYKIFPEKRLTAAMPKVMAGDIVLFGSFYALTGSLRQPLMEFIRGAKSNGAFIMYDPNFRKAHLDELEILRPWILENIGMADLVRGSDEDFMNIFGASDVDQAYLQVAKAGCKHLVYTKGSNGIDVRSYRHSRHYSVPPIRVISTIGAGDAFNAGIIYALKDYKCNWSDTLTWEWHELILAGIMFSANVCQSLDNYISVDYGNQLKQT